MKYKKKKDLKDVLSYECDIYSHYMFPSFSRYILARVKREPARMIWRWQYVSRIVDYYDSRRKKSRNPWYKIWFFVYICMRNRFAEQLGMDVCTANIGKGLLIYHPNNVINSFSLIGDNLHLHGGNVIGNSGPNDPEGCPIIGNNVVFGAGAMAIGRIKIADGIKIAAGAIVVKDVLEKGCTVAGVPAKIVKKHET